MGGFKLHFIKEKKKEKQFKLYIYKNTHNSALCWWRCCDQQRVFL